MIRALGALRVATLALAAAGAAAAQSPPPSVPGFAAGRLDDLRHWESRFQAVPQPDSALKHLRILTEEPHIAGTAAGYATAVYVRDRMRAYGLEAELVPYEVLLNYPKEVALELIEPERRRLSLREVAIPGDKDSADSSFVDGFHGYSADGEVTAQVVYVNYGRPEDYEALEKLGVGVQGKIVLARYGKLFRGLKVRIAQERGAAGVIIYSDPADDGYAKGDVYPDGPWRHPSAIQRGSVMFLSNAPGDPTTPGWASVKGARRVPRAQAASLPKIPSLPLSYGEAEHILRALAGPVVPDGFQGALPFAYHVGPGAAKLRMKVVNDYAIRPIWNVVATIRGSERPDRWVVCGNHRDAWTYGAVDPNSGSAAALEMARAFGELLREGWRPKRSIVLCSWDAEEYGLVGSVEWGEHLRGELPGKVVAYLNMDSAVRGRDLAMSGVPSLRDHLHAAARDVLDPVTGRGLHLEWEKGAKKDAKAKWRQRERLRSARGLASRPLEAELGDLGSGSDYTVFIDHLGIPSADIRFSGADGIYHSAYDNLYWVEKFGDPLLVYHAASARFWGLATLRLADADVLPLRYTRYAARIHDYLDDFEESLADAAADAAPGAEPLRADLTRARTLTTRIQIAAEKLESEIGRALASRGERVFGHSFAAVDDALVAVERDFLAPDGIRGRPWFRHLIYAPGKDTGYAAIPLPEPVHGFKERNAADLAAGMRRLEAALERAAVRLEGVAAGG